MLGLGLEMGGSAQPNAQQGQPEIFWFMAIIHSTAWFRKQRSM